jgi:G:T/U-mismatch repair DNA glycosylase
MISVHPYEPFIPLNASKLIIGSIPPARFCTETPIELFDLDVPFYYGSRDNRFWRTLGEITATDFLMENSEDAIEQRKRFLDERDIGITDIIQSCVHKDGNADDKSLLDIRHKDLKGLLIQFPAIDTLLYTSEFIKGQVYRQTGVYHRSIANNPKAKELIIGDKIYKVHILYSPSANALRNMGKGGGQKRRQQYERLFSVSN